jgi:hypothetical protein
MIASIRPLFDMCVKTSTFTAVLQVFNKSFTTGRTSLTTSRPSILALSFSSTTYSSNPLKSVLAISFRMLLPIISISNLSSIVLASPLRMLTFNRMIIRLTHYLSAVCAFSLNMVSSDLITQRSKPMEPHPIPAQQVRGQADHPRTGRWAPLRVQVIWSPLLLPPFLASWRPIPRFYFN